MPYKITVVETFPPNEAGIKSVVEDSTTNVTQKLSALKSAAPDPVERFSQTVDVVDIRRVIDAVNPKPKRQRKARAGKEEKS